ncbi:exonuclease subunit SbcD [Fibrella aquatilis]|uniref:Nuclease SbcCD subunit D n=1 Tax=Fibrella aquatilis TaxID=2817059 RepID=A0A939GDI5_9BACT|nr:exonuclease subunit SbcD [Fibrella aquatilis]MBO0934860.1 exonuclease SbcCD subunit D C-terminal domain-containing protein [Fibrella aquatilis]
MKILHTADWHLGKRLYRADLRDDHAHFLTWLIEQVQHRQIDVLLISGDVFDTTNPNDGSMQLYYQFLTQLLPLSVTIIITGGNHDSATKLNAPKELLRHLNIYVVGCTNGNCHDEVIQLANGSVDLLVAAVPYLRDADLRQSISGQRYEDRVEAVRMGIRNHYERIADHCHAAFAGVPALAMGHLYVNGASVSESEREIHAVGGQAAFSSEHFPNGFAYVALGHIHVPQRVGGSDSVRYCGSPIPLSFGERTNAHQLLEITVDNGLVTAVESVVVPQSRQLLHITGTLEEVREQLNVLERTHTLPALVEVLVDEPSESLSTRMHFDQLQRDYKEAPFILAKTRLLFRNKRKSLEALFGAETHLADLTYLDVFEQRLSQSDVDEQQRAQLIDTYQQLYKLVTEQAAPVNYENSPNPVS